MLGVRALVGIGEGSYYPAGTPMLAAYYPPARRASIMSRWAIGALTGGAVGFIIATVVKAAGLDWRQAFYIAAVPGLVLAVLIFFTREKVRNEDDPPASQEVSQGSIVSKTREYLRIPTFRVILATHALGFFALYSIATFLVIYLGDVYGTDAYGKAGLSDTLVVALPGVVLLVGGIAGNLIGSAWANRMSRRYAGARVRVGGLGFLLAAPAVALTLLAPYVLPTLPFFHDANPSTQVRIGVTIFVVFGLLASTALNIYNGPTGAALQDVVPPKERAAAGGVELTLAHLLGDVYAGPAVGALSVALGSWLGGKQIGLAMLLTCPVFLIASGIVGIRGSRHYAGDVAALGSNADAMLGTHALEAEAARA
jgi:MFS family permease